jgi:hypothetical protein
LGAAENSTLSKSSRVLVGWLWPGGAPPVGLGGLVDSQQFHYATTKIANSEKMRLLRLLHGRVRSSGGRARRRLPTYLASSRAETMWLCVHQHGSTGSTAARQRGSTAARSAPDFRMSSFFACRLVVASPRCSDGNLSRLTSLLAAAEHDLNHGSLLPSSHQPHTHAGDLIDRCCVSPAPRAHPLRSLVPSPV